MTCPQSITVIAPSGQTFATVAYSEPTRAGGTGPYSGITCDMMSGHFFNTGTRTVTCSVTDALTTATCTFDVQVINATRKFVILKKKKKKKKNTYHNVV